MECREYHKFFNSFINNELDYKETRELLEAYCETMGVTRSEALRTAIEGLKTDKKLRKK